VAQKEARTTLKSPKTQKARLDRITVQAITDVAKTIDGRVQRLNKPEVKFPVRSLGNVRYDLRRATSRSARRPRAAR